MDAERYRQLKDLFHHLAEASETDRRAALDALEAEDIELATRLVAMLAAHEGAADLLREERLEQRQSPAEAGVRIGPYRVTGELGRGGMGTVFLAERDDGSFHQQVALKVIKRGMDTDEIIRRFVAERQILARLVHPNIARLLDGGSTVDGRPYFAMERVEGRPLGIYCASLQLGIEARLRLFLEVCDAVAFAHRSLVVHRDLKPANVLVGADGRPKLLDFGIAKLLAPAPGEPAGEGNGMHPTLTLAERAPMTPDYASPEQRQGLPVTTATDVHGLGVLLHELLTGWTPTAAARQLGGSSPRLPSRVIRALGAPGFHDRSPRLARHLEGDLDTILCKAIEPDPQRRYRSARELAEDLERHLTRQPVRARRPTLGYRLGRAIRRHRLASALLLAVLISAALATYQAQQVRRQRDHAERERLRAEAVSSFLVNLFKAADPTRSRGAEVPVRDILEEGLRQLRAPEAARPGEPVPAAGHGLAADPATRAYLLHVVGEVFDQLGLDAKAREAFEDASSLRSRLTGREAELDLAATLTLLADVLRQQGNTTASDPLYRRALAIRRRLLGPDSTAVAESLNGLALLRRYQGEFDEAESLFREAIALRRRGGAEAEVELAESLSNLAALEIERGRPDEAPALLGEAREILRRRLDEGDPRVASGLHNLGALLHRLGRFEAAAASLREAAALRRRVLGPAHPDLAVTLTALATVEDQRGDLDAVETAQREALAILRDSYGGAHLDVADALLGLASVLRKKADAAAARPLAEEAVAMYRALPGDRRADVANALNTLALVRRDFGDLGAAETLAREGLRLRRSALGEDHPDVAGSLNTLASLLHLRRRLVEAEARYREAVGVRRRALRPGHPALATSLSGLGAVLVEAGRLEEAEASLLEAAAIHRQGSPPNLKEIARIETILAACRDRLAGRESRRPPKAP